MIVVAKDETGGECGGTRTLKKSGLRLVQSGPVNKRTGRTPLLRSGLMLAGFVPLGVGQETLVGSGVRVASVYEKTGRSVGRTGPGEETAGKRDVRS